MNATYAMIGSHPTLRFERRLRHTVERVWRAITEPSELAHWFPSTVELELRVGGRMTFTFEQDLSEYAELPEGTHTLRGEVTALEPPHLFAFTWGDDQLRFELEPADGGASTELRFSVVLDATDKAARDAAGWHVCLDGLEHHLGGAETEAPGDEPTDEWRGVYERYAARGFPTGAAIPG